MELIFATSNEHKVKEIASVCPDFIQVKTMKEAGFTGELPETQETIEGNSLQKAETLFKELHKPCFSEDTGLEIDALNGLPGVNTARFAGENCTFKDNINKVLTLMEGQENRKARFKTVITYYNSGEYVQFEGICYGSILEKESGLDGFGYDPIFCPEGDSRSFAEMTLEEKNNYSHRKKAFEKFATFLENLTSN